MSQLSIRDLTFSYCSLDEKTGEPNGQTKQVLSGVSLELEAGGYYVLCGATGCGKSTLLRLCKPELSPIGIVGGTIDRGELSEPGAIGYVMQNPADQAVTDKVWHELAFGAESIGMKPETIRRRIAEVSSYFGINDWYDRDIAELSGGQLQTVNLASALVMNPKLLILDEPTSQLDPIAAMDFLRMIEQLNRELGITILIAEHRLEEILPVADRVFYMEKGVIDITGTPDEFLRQADSTKSVYGALPFAGRCSLALQGDKTDTLPLTIRDGRRFLRAAASSLACNREALQEPENEKAAEKAVEKAVGKKVEETGEPILACKDIWFRYTKKGPDIVRGAKLALYSGEIVCLLGSNGSGKTTFLKIVSGILHEQEGSKYLCDKKYRDNYTDIGYLPQDVETMFVTDSVRKELHLVGIDEEDFRHPYDLSGGEKQQLALRKLLATNRKVLLLDEPGKGLDANAKEELGKTLRSLAEEGYAILVVTHDCEFAARFADKCGMFFHGEIVSLATTRAFFRENRFYTTAAARLAVDIVPDVLTEADLMQRIQGPLTEETLAHRLPDATGETVGGDRHE